LSFDDEVEELIESSVVITVEVVDATGQSVTTDVVVTYRRAGDSYILTFPNGQTTVVRGTGTADAQFGGRTAASVPSGGAPSVLRHFDPNVLANIARGAGVLADTAEAVFIVIKGVRALQADESLVEAIGADVARFAGGGLSAAATAAALRQSAVSLPPWARATVWLAAGFLGTQVGEAAFNAIVVTSRCPNPLFEEFYTTEGAEKWTRECGLPVPPLWPPTA
jgi:hypothetical protein